MPTAEYDQKRDPALRRDFLRRVAGWRTGTALDFGAGSGWAARNLHEWGWDVTAVDREFPSHVAREQDIKWIEGDFGVDRIRELPEVDLVLGLSVLHHFQDWRGAYFALRSRGRRFLYDVPARDETTNLVVNSRVAPMLHDWVTARDQILAYSKSFIGGEFMRPVLLSSYVDRVGMVMAGNGWTTRQWADVGSLIRRTTIAGSLNLVVQEPIVMNEWTNTEFGTVRHREALLQGYRVTLCRMPESEDPQLIEVLADVHLRTQLGLVDGDRVVIGL